MDTDLYKKVWQREDPLYILNHRLHDGVKPDQLAKRAEDRVERFFVRHFPNAIPTQNAKVLELGSGVGWIMQAFLQQFPCTTSITGLDISANCIQKARKRWLDNRANFVLYNGISIPFADNSFHNIYSVSCLQHIEKHAAFLILTDLYRVLQPGGHATLHFLDISHITHARHGYFTYCKDYLAGRENMHRLYFYTAEELQVLLQTVIGVQAFSIIREGTSLLVYFSKST